MVLDSLKQESVQLREDTLRLLNKKDHGVGPQQVQHILRLESYIRELEEGIRQESEAKNIFLKDIAMYRDNLEVVEEENRMLRNQSYGQQNCVDIVDEMVSIKTETNVPEYPNPFAKYGVPRLAIFSPP